MWHQSSWPGLQPAHGNSDFDEEDYSKLVTSGKDCDLQRTVMHGDEQGI
jgi:hypothetical protein